MYCTRTPRPPARFTPARSCVLRTSKQLISSHTPTNFFKLVSTRHPLSPQPTTATQTRQAVRAYHKLCSILSNQPFSPPYPWLITSRTYRTSHAKSPSVKGKQRQSSTNMTLGSAFSSHRDQRALRCPETHLAAPLSPNLETSVLSKFGCCTVNAVKHTSS